MIRFWNKYNGQIILLGVIILMIVGAQDKEPIADDDLSWHQTIGILISIGIAFSLIQIASEFIKAIRKQGYKAERILGFLVLAITLAGFNLANYRNHKTYFILTIILFFVFAISSLFSNSKE